ncbi:MAG: tetratricopeptide repeat protein [Bacteroidota bacterium]
MSSFRLKPLGLALLFFLIPSVSCSQDTQENAEFKLAVGLYNDKMYDLAVEQLKRFIDAYPNSQQGVQARFYLGLTQMVLKRYGDSRVTFQNFALSYPENPQAPDAWWSVAQSYVEMKNYPEAASAFERLKVFHPKSKRAPEALLQSAVYFRLAGAMDKVKTVLRTLTQEYPTSDLVPEARLQLAETYSDEGNLDQARGELKRIIGRSGEASFKARALLLTGEIYQQQEKPEEAEKAYRDIIQSYADSSAFPEASYQLGVLEQEFGRYLESITDFKRVVTDTSFSSANLKQRSLFGICRSYFELNDFSNTLLNVNELLNQASISSAQGLVEGQSLSPELAHEARLLSASAHEALKDYAAELDDYKTITLDTSRTVDKRIGYVGAARVSRALKDFRDAISYLQSFLTLYPDDPNTPEALYLLGDVYSNTNEMGAEKNAIANYQTILNRFPRSPLVDDALFSIGSVHEKAKEFDPALSSYRELITRYPASPFAAQAKERINWITTFQATPSSESLGKLAELLARLISGESKGESAFHLGEIYLNDLKDFTAAAKMFASAIANAVPEPNLAEAFYYRAQAYQLLVQKNQAPSDTAVQAYEEYLNRYPSQQHSADAAAEIALLRISQPGQADPMKISEDFVLKYPASTSGDLPVLAAADSMQARGKYDRAALAYEQLLAWFPSSTLKEEALYNLGRSLQESGKTDSAQIILNSYTDKYPTGSQGALVLSTQAKEGLQSGKAQESVSLYKRLVRDYYYTPQAEGAKFEMCQALAGSGHLDSAIARCQALLQEQREDLFRREDSLEVLHLLGSLYQQKGMRSNAKKYYLACLKQDRTSERSAEVLFNLGQLYREDGNAETAIGFFKQAVEINPDRRVRENLANLLFDTEDYSAANIQFTELAKTATSDDERKTLESRIIIGLIRLGNLAEADERTRQFSETHKEVDEELAEIQIEKGTYYFRKQEYTPAQKTFEKLIKDYDETKAGPTAQYWLAKISEANGQNQDALEKYERILKDFPHAEILPKVYLALGNINYRTEKFETAVRYYRMVVDSVSSPPDVLQSAMNNLIEAYKTVGLFEAALQLTRTFIEKYPNDESVIDKRIDIGVLYEKLGYHDQSVMYLQGLLEDTDVDLEAEIRYYIGEAYFGKADYDRAILEFLKVPYLVTTKGRVDWTPNAFYMSGQSYEKMGKYDQAISMYQQIVDRSGVDQTFKAAAQKEIDRVNALVKKPGKRPDD